MANAWRYLDSSLIQANQLCVKLKSVRVLSLELFLATFFPWFAVVDRLHGDRLDAHARQSWVAAELFIVGACNREGERLCGFSFDNLFID